MKNSLKEYMKSIDDNKNSSLGLLAHSISSQSMFHAQNEFGAILVAFGDGMYQLSEYQTKFVKIQYFLSLFRFNF